jgi:hypothetical protein
MIKLIDLLRESQGILGNYTPKSFAPDLTSLNKEEHATVMNDLRKERMGLMDYIGFIHSMIGYDPIYKVIFSKLFRANKNKIDFSLDQSDLLKDWNKETPDSVKLQKFKTFYEKHKDNFPNWALENKKLYQDALQAILPSLNEAELSTHYSERKAERKEILDIIIPSKAYEGYNLDNVKDKLIPLLKSKLLSQLEALENKDIKASIAFNIGYQVFFPRLENQGEFYPIQMITKATAGGSSIEKENKGIIYGAIVKDNTLITLIILNDISSSFFKEKIIEHDKRIGKVNNKETKIFKDPNCDFIINIDELFGKKVEKPREEKTEEDSLPYKVKTDYRLKSKFTHKKYGTGTVIKTSEGGGKPNSIGKVDWIDVRFDNPSGGRPAFTERFNRLITNVYYDKQLKND